MPLLGGDMKKTDADTAPIEVASPPCSMHEVDPAYMGLSAATSPAHSLGRAELTRLGDALLQDLPDAIIFSDRDGLIRFWNRGAERIFGFTEIEAIGQSLDIIIPERLRQRHWEGYQQMMATGQSRHAPEELLAVPAITKSGARLSIQFTVAAVSGEEGSIAGIVAVLRDVTATFDEMRRLRRS
jgi:PAS domain S-box-containing protein